MNKPASQHPHRALASRFLVLRRLHYVGANGQVAYWCAGSPGPMQALGAASSLLMRAGIGGTCIRGSLRSAGLIVHEHEPRLERVRVKNAKHLRTLAYQFRAVSAVSRDDHVGKSVSLSSQPKIFADGIATLMIEIDGQAELDILAVQRYLPRIRVAGGVVTRSGFNPNHCLFDSLEDAAEAIGGGFTLIDRSDLLQPEPGEQDALDAFLRATSRTDRHAHNPRSSSTTENSVDDAHESSTPDDDHDDHPKTPDLVMVSPKPRAQQAKHANPWLMPYLRGYAAFEEPRNRPHVREGFTHAYAEPMVALGQLVSVRRQLPSMWRYDRPSPKIYGVTPVVA